MSPAAHAALAGFLCAAPALALLAARWAAVRGALDGKARRKLLFSTIRFGAASVAACSVLAALAGRLALPAFWQLLAVALTAWLLLRLFPR